MPARAFDWKLLEGIGPAELPDRLRNELGLPPGAPVGAHHVVGGDGATLDPRRHLHLHDVVVQCGSCGTSFEFGDAEVGVKGWLDAPSSQLLTCPECAASIRITGMLADAEQGSEDAGAWIVTTQLTTQPDRSGPGWSPLLSAEVDLEVDEPTPVPPPPSAAPEPLVTGPAPPPPPSAAPEPLVTGPAPPPPAALVPPTPAAEAPSSPAPELATPTKKRGTKRRRPWATVLIGAVIVAVVAGAVVGVRMLMERCTDIVAGADLAGCGFVDRDFTDYDLAGADLSGADLSGAILTGAVLKKADLTETVFAGADLTDASLFEATLPNADFTGATLTDADLRDTEAGGAIFTDAVLTDVRLLRSNLVGATFTNANLRGADLSDATADGAVFTGVQASGVDFPKVTLAGAQFDGADLHDANMFGVNLSSANLAGANLAGVRLERANVTGANLTGAKLDGALLRDIEGLTDAQLVVAFGVPEDSLAVALVEHGIQFESQAQLATGVAAARDGRPVADAAPYESGPTYHPAVVLPPDGDEVPDWAAQLGVSPGLRFTELVVVPDSETELVEICTYRYADGSQAEPITRLRMVTTVTVVAAASGDVVAEQVFQGGEPRACLAEMSASLAGSTFMGDPPPSAEIVGWLQSYVNTP